MSENRILKTYGIAILSAVIIAFLIRFFVVEAYRIPSSSMRPTLEPGDTIFVAKYPFGIRLPGNPKPVRRGRTAERGEVVVFSFPDERHRDYIKRVVAIGGDTIAVKEGRVILNGSSITLPHAKDALCGQEQAGDRIYGICWDPPLMADVPEQKVPPHAVFVLNDLRSQSNDILKARAWGVIPNKFVKGKAAVVWLSVQPRTLGAHWFPKFRFDRILRKIE